MLDATLQALRGKTTTPPQGFPHAPLDWTPESARQIARQEELKLTDTHWQVIRALQDYFARNEENSIQGRDLHDALDERFHAQGGIKHLYQLFPGGPVAQGCRLAGLKAPSGAVDPNFGSVM
jgi:TusE/DsrC/DsvC family sulfur relay protein